MISAIGSAPARPTSFMSLFAKFKGDSASLPPRLPLSMVLPAFVGASLVVALIAWMAEHFETALLLGSFGASAGLVFGYPDVLFSQPRNLVAGHLLSTLVGLAFLHGCGPHWWSVGLAVGTAVALMMLTSTVHPPAASNPVIVYLMQPDWSFALFPTLAGSLILVVTALFYHNLTRKTRWPKFW